MVKENTTYTTWYHDSTATDTYSSPYWEWKVPTYLNEKNYIHICPNCNRLIEKEGFDIEIGSAPVKYLKFCNKECYEEWKKNGRREAMLL